ncbi:hypothetical protein DVA76_17880, partial [Acinetobacter baumannii]
IPMSMFHNTYIEDCGPHKCRNILYFVGHDSMMVGNLMSGIVPWSNMWRAPQPMLRMNPVKLW